MDEIARIELIDVVSETVRNELSAHTFDTGITDAQISALADAIGSRIGGSGDVKRELVELRKAVESISPKVDLPKKDVESAVLSALKKLETKITTSITSSTSVADRRRRRIERHHRLATSITWLFTIVTLLFATLLSYSLGEIGYLWLCASGLCTIASQAFVDFDDDCTRNYVIWTVTSVIPLITAVIALVNVIAKLA